MTADTKQTNFTVYSDGSGWKDGIIGYCAVIINNRNKKSNLVMGSMTNSTVQRAELHGVVEAIRYIFTSDNFFDGITVDVFTDNLNVANSAMYNSQRKESRDLWLQYDFFAEKMSIKVNHIPRSSDAYNITADLHASTLRSILQSYVNDI